MPHQKRLPTNFTIDCILSKSKDNDEEKSRHHSQLSLHPLNKVLESNPWIPNCSLVLPFNPSSHQRRINFSPSTSNYFNYPPNYVNHQPFTSAFNYFYPTTTASVDIPSPNLLNNLNHLQPKYSVYETSSDNLNRNDSLSLNLIVNNNNNEEINALKNDFESKSMDSSSSSIVYKCAICLKIFENCEMLKIHDKIHMKPKYECNVCKKIFSQLRNYKYHMSVHLGTKEFAADCPECGKTFNDKGYLSSHLKIHRNKKEYNCSYCPKSFNQRVAFNMHVRIHLGLKPHTCEECGKQFSRKMLLKQHHRTHSGEKPYKCTFSGCEKRFADRSNMILHNRLHSGIKPFACTICPKRFSKKHHLGTHMNYHTGNKPYDCLHGCGQKFTQSSNMRTHSKKCQFKSQISPLNHLLRDEQSQVHQLS